jgi:HSP20 family molecular chaperone IbpA
MGRIPITAITNPIDMIPIFEELDRLMSAIESRAYQAFEARGHQHGNDLADWFAAEQQVLGAPAADVATLADRYIFRIGLSGFTEHEITILAAPGDLVLRAETRTATRTEDCQMCLKVMRRFTLPPDAHVPAATAKLHRGLLTIDTPRNNPLDTTG